MRVVNTDVVSYQYKTPEKCLETAERERDKKYPTACLNERQHFTPFIALVDGLLGVEAKGALKCISSRINQKWKDPYSHTCGYMNIRGAITLLRATHRCIWGGIVLESRISVTRPQWEDGAGIHLFR